MGQQLASFHSFFLLAPGHVQIYKKPRKDISAEVIISPHHHIYSYTNYMKWREETQETYPHIAHNLLSHSGEKGNEGEGTEKELREC